MEPNPNKWKVLMGAGAEMFTPSESFQFVSQHRDGLTAEYL